MEDMGVVNSFLKDIEKIIEKYPEMGVACVVCQGKAAGACMVGDVEELTQATSAVILEKASIGNVLLAAAQESIIIMEKSNTAFLEKVNKAKGSKKIGEC